MKAFKPNQFNQTRAAQLGLAQAGEPAPIEFLVQFNIQAGHLHSDTDIDVVVISCAGQQWINAKMFFKNDAHFHQTLAKFNHGKSRSRHVHALMISVPEITTYPFLPLRWVRDNLGAHEHTTDVLFALERALQEQAKQGGDVVDGTLLKVYEDVTVVDAPANQQ